MKYVQNQSMTSEDETCWSIVSGARAGNDQARQRFAQIYSPVVRAFLNARWRGSALRQKVDDAAQDVFMDCFRDDGALERVSSDRPNGFRAFLFGVVRHVALRYEERSGKEARRSASRSVVPEEIQADEEGLSRLFDRSFAQAMMERAAKRQAREAKARGSDALVRVKILQLRFSRGLPVREIADQLNAEPARVHREYAKAREEFKDALRAEVAFHSPGTPRAIEQECEELLALLRREN